MSMAMKARGGSAKERSVFVGNIPYDVTEEQLREIFSEVGSVINFRLVTDRESGKPKGYGFCEYADGATALSAMRNLNGYEVNGRNLRVDFADGGASGGGGGGGGGGGFGGGAGGGGGGNGGGGPNAPSVSGEVLINAIEGAISKFGPVKLYDMLVNLKEHARQRPELTKGILGANPALTHAIVQCFKSLNIPIPSPTETQSGLLSAPLLPPPRPMGGVLPPPQRSPLHAMGPGGGILGMAPPGMPPPPPPVLSAPPPAKPGSRWSSRPGPLVAGGGAALPMPGLPPHMGGAPPPPAAATQPPPMAMYQPPPVSQQLQPPPLMPTPTAPAAQRSRDPRARARDPRLAKRASSDLEPQSDDKRIKTEGEYRPTTGQESNAGTSEYEAIAALARDMTPDKLNMLPPEERQLLLSYMHQHGIKTEYQ